MSEKLEIVILGGGTAGWMCASALATLVGEKVCSITLIESDEIGSVGVGEATLPHMKEFNDLIGINEADMMKHTQATMKLGIEFVDWGKVGNSYIHPFGRHGNVLGGSEFHQHWARVRQFSNTKDIGSYSYAVQSSRHYKFQFPDLNKNGVGSTFSYAYHFDAALYAKYLRVFSKQKQVKRIEGRVSHVENHVETGNIKSITLENGEIVSGDFFIDCSGFNSLLLARNLKSSFEDWSKWLVCDRALAMPSEKLAKLPPYTQSRAKNAGWQWKIPLQQRTGNGYVYCSQYISDDEAANSLLSDVKGESFAEPRLLKFKAGRYQKTWIKNCLALGLSSGFLEPLESTSIYLIQVSILNFIKLFPGKRPQLALINEYNRLIDFEYSRIRDFLILHYHLNQRTDAEIWRYCRNMPIPESLQEKIAIFKHRGYVDTYKYGLFSLPSWISVLNGQHLLQQGTDPFADRIPVEAVSNKLDELIVEIENNLDNIPAHDDFLSRYCPVSL